MMVRSSSRMPLASSRAASRVLSSTRSAASGPAMSLSRLPAGLVVVCFVRAFAGLAPADHLILGRPSLSPRVVGPFNGGVLCRRNVRRRVWAVGGEVPLETGLGVIAASEPGCAMGELPAPAAETGIPVGARTEAEPPSAPCDFPAVTPGAFICGYMYPVGQVALTAADPRGCTCHGASPAVDGDLGHGSSSFSGSRDQARLTRSAWRSLRTVARILRACWAWQ